MCSLHLCRPVSGEIARWTLFHDFFGLLSYSSKSPMSSKVTMDMTKFSITSVLNCLGLVKRYKATHFLIYQPACRLALDDQTDSQSARHIFAY